jgi:hypothetical protein
MRYGTSKVVDHPCIPVSLTAVFFGREIGRFMLQEWTRHECEDAVSSFWEEVLSEPTAVNLQDPDEL